MLQGDRQASLGHASAEMTALYTTEDIDRRRPITEQIAADLVQPVKISPGTAEQKAEVTEDTKALPTQKAEDE
jgi:hypothetical protein